MYYVLTYYVLPTINFIIRILFFIQYRHIVISFYLV